MKKKKQQKILYAIIILSVIGLITSVYLTINHYLPPTEGSFCDINAQVSCSLVNTSVFSEIFNIPVALLGSLWFVLMILLCYKALKKEEIFVHSIFILSILGLVSIAYFVVAEIILKALCPLCTVVHLLLLSIFILAFILHLKHKKHLWEKIVKNLRMWIVGVVIIAIAIVVIFNVQRGPTENYDELAKCITEKGVNMYGSFRCGICAKTRSMFGSSFQYINEIECHPQGENPQTELCLEKGIEGTPTWILEPQGEEIKREFGFLSIEELKEFSGCE